MTADFGTYRNQYGKIVHDRGPSVGQVGLITRLVNEKVAPNDYIAGLIENFRNEELSGRNARVLIDALINAKSQIVAPSILGLQDPDGKPASPKQLEWVDKLLGEKDIPEADFTSIMGFVAEGLTGRHAGHILDYLFDRPKAGVVHSEGFVGEIGEKISVSGELVTFRLIPTKFGETNLIVVRFQDEGMTKEVKTFSNAKSFAGLAEGMHITITGEVKSHEPAGQYGGEATVLKAPKAEYVGDGEGLVGQRIEEEAEPVAVYDEALGGSIFTMPELAQAMADEKAGAPLPLQQDAVQAPEKGEDVLSFWGLN